jgi:hypothetical protein
MNKQMKNSLQESNEKSVLFDVSLKSKNEESPSNKGSIKQEKAIILIKEENSNKQKNVINSINDTIDDKSKQSENEHKKKLQINSINDTISDRKNKIISTINSKKIQKSSPKKVEYEDLNSSNLALIEETLAKSLETFQNNIVNTTKSNKINTTKSSFKHEIYNGNTDKVALYQHLTNEWNKTPFLNKTKSSGKLKFVTATQYTINNYKSENVISVFIS